MSFPQLLSLNHLNSVSRLFLNSQCSQSCSRNERSPLYRHCVYLTAYFLVFMKFMLWNKPVRSCSNNKNVHILWEEYKEAIKRSILPPDSHESIRVMRIMREILQAMHEALGLNGEIKLSYGSSPKSHEELISKRKSSVGRRKISLFKNGGTKRLERLNWEVIVVNIPLKIAIYWGDGRVTIFTGCLKHYTMDDNIAYIIGHEVGHAVSSLDTKLFMVANSIANKSWVTSRIKKLVELSKLHIKRKNELEADYNGIMLMAMAGYDPRIAPKHHEEEFGATWDDFERAHPNGERRSRFVSHPKVMTKAMAIYEQSRCHSRLP